MAALLLGSALAAIPILIWNAGHEWASILYQIRDRHGDLNLSWVRYGRFWLVEILCLGVALFWFSAG